METNPQDKFGNDADQDAHVFPCQVIWWMPGRRWMTIRSWKRMVPPTLAAQ